MILEYNSFRLPEELRKRLAKPQGKLYDGIKPEKKVVTFLKLNNPPITIAVGDICVATVIAAGFYPEISIIDNKTKRKQLLTDKHSNSLLTESIYNEYENKIREHNPAATIQKKSWFAVEQAINRYLSKNEKTLITIEGEEDLLVIPAVIQSPNDSAVIYGQPNQGIVIIMVSKDVKKNFIKLFREFSPVFEN
jgi:uncharacterized protein (UPF0218 family)